MASSFRSLREWCGVQLWTISTLVQLHMWDLYVVTKWWMAASLHRETVMVQPSWNHKHDRMKDLFINTHKKPTDTQSPQANTICSPCTRWLSAVSITLQVQHYLLQLESFYRNVLFPWQPSSLPNTEKSIKINVSYSECTDPWQAFVSWRIYKHLGHTTRLSIFL